MIIDDDMFGMNYLILKIYIYLFFVYCCKELIGMHPVDFHYVFDLLNRKQDQTHHHNLQSATKNYLTKIESSFRKPNNKSFFVFIQRA